MNDVRQPFVLPRPQVPWWRDQARALRRAYVRSRRERAAAEQLKRWNSELNWREFWHGRLFLESYPRIIQVGTNWTCNLKCSFCRLTMDWTQAQLRRLPARELAISDRVQETVERLLPYAEMMVLTPLGEPLLWAGLKPLLELHARVGSHNLALTTNGMLLNERNVERLIEGQLSQLYVSIDSNDPEIYPTLRVGGDLATVEAGVRRLVARRRASGAPWPRLTMNATFMRRNIEQLPSMVRWAHELGFDEISVQLMEIENPEHEPEFLGHFPDLAREMVLRALAVGREVGLIVLPHLALRNLISAAGEGHNVADHQFQGASPIMPGKPDLAGAPDAKGSQPARPSGAHAAASGCADCHAAAPPLADALIDPALDMRHKTLVEKCHYPWYNLLIDTDGDARPCCWADASWGNLNQLSFEEIWNGERAQAMRRAFLANHIPPSCRRKHCRVDL